MENIFDTHAHYDDKAFDSDRHDLLASLPSKGVTGVVNAAVDLNSSLAVTELAERYDFVYAAVGIHPHEAKDAPAGLAESLDKLLRHPKVKAVGETGLDYHYDFSPRDVQQNVFEEHLKIALAHDMPVIVHDREAHADTLELLKKYRPKGIIHCYSGSAEMAAEVLRLGLYIGFTGVVTFKNARKVLEAVKAVPLDRLLLETDCPYMAPEPYRGKRCDSSMLIETARAVSFAKGIPLDELLSVASHNARAVYNIG